MGMLNYQVKKIRCASLVLVMFALGNFSLNAAEKNRDNDLSERPYHINKFWDNWFLGAGVGTMTFYGNHADEGSFGGRVTPTFNLHLGKWITPVFGLRGDFYWNRTKSYDIYENNPFAYEEVEPGVYKTRFTTVSLAVEAMMDFSTLVKGYDSRRLYSLIGYFGGGWIRNCTRHHPNDAVIAAGIVNRFRVNDAWNINLELRANIFHEGMDGTKGGGNWDQDMTTGLMIGASYRFKKRGFDRCQLNEAEMADIRRQLVAMQDENRSLRAKLEEKPKECVHEVVRKETLVSDMGVFFAIDKYELTQKERVNLGFYARMIKQVPDKKFVITGYCDKQTGSKAYNEELSRKRAETVFHTLVDEFGVNKEQLVIDYKGGVDYMFYDEAHLSRVTIVKMKP